MSFALGARYLLVNEQHHTHHEAEVLFFVVALGELISIWSFKQYRLSMLYVSLGRSIVMTLQQIASPQVEESRTPEGIGSPPYSPRPSECERPRLPLNILLELKQSCAVLVNDTNPPTDEYENLPDPREALHKYDQAQAAKKRAKERAEAQEATKAANEEQQSFFSRRPRGETPEPSQPPAPYKHVPINAATSFESTAIPRRPSQKYRSESANFEPIEPTHTRTSANARVREEEQEDSLFQIRAALESRPKTSAAACIDYPTPSNEISAETSASTSRSQTTDYTHGKRRISTGLTSINTSGEEKRSSYIKERVSEQIHQDGASASLADATAKAWMMQELARRRAEYKAGPARPASRASGKPASIDDQQRSRAGSIASSVIDGMRDYVRPRASMDSLRSTRSDSGLSRSGSRSSSLKRRDSNGGWRSQLRRRSSFSSWRNKPQVEEANSPQPGALDLNRDLPALPGLDQYVEKKPKPAHIAQIMRAPRQKKPKDQPPQPQSIPPPAVVVAPLSPQEEQRRQFEIRRAVEEKMRTSTSRGSDRRPATAGSGPVPSASSSNMYHTALQPPPHFPEYPRTQSQPVVSTVNKAPSAAVLEMPKAQEGKKPSLRKRLSRFWSSGGGKNGRDMPGKMVAAN